MHKGIWGELETKEQQTEQPSLPVLTKLEGKAELAVWKEVSCDAAQLFTGLQGNQVILRGFYLNGCSFSCMMWGCGSHNREGWKPCLQRGCILISRGWLGMSPPHHTQIIIELHPCLRGCSWKAESQHQVPKRETTSRYLKGEAERQEKEKI